MRGNCDVEMLIVACHGLTSELGFDSEDFRENLTTFKTRNGQQSKRSRSLIETSHLITRCVPYVTDEMIFE